MYMKKFLLMLLLSALCSVGFAQRMNYINVSRLADGRYYDESAGIKVSGWVLDGKKTGTWIECHSDSEMPHFIVQYIDDNIEGLYMEIDKQGSVTKQMEYKDGKMEGTYLKWAKGGRLIEMVSYRNGEKDGQSKICYERGTIQEESNYKEGKRDGVTIWYAFAEKEQGPKVAMYTYKNGRFDGVQETYYDNGNVKTRKMFVDNVQNGMAVEFYEDGSVKSETNYKNGEISGKVKEYEMGKKTY